MANTGVTGRVVNKDTGAGVGGLKVVAYDVEQFLRDVEMGSATTSSSGSFSISYSKWAYGIERKPSIRIRIFDFVNRLLYQSPEYPDRSDATFTVEDIKIPNAVLQGWLVTLRTRSAAMLSQGNLVSALIDNKRAWEQLTQEVKAANQYIFSAQLSFDVKKLFTVFNPGSPAIGERLEEKLLEANKSRGVDVRLLMNDTIGLPYPADTAGSVEDYFSEKMPHTAQLGRFRMPYNTPMHAKLTVIDDRVALMNASPLMQEYFDDVSHSIDDRRRGKMEWPKNAIKVPIHDVSISLKGPCVKHLYETFGLLWRDTVGAVPEAAAPVPPPETNAAVQIVRTLPANRFTTPPDAVPKNGETGILEAYQRAIANAEDFIYLENQYFTEEAIATALILKLKQSSQVQLIMLINNKVDIPFYQKMQTRLIRQFLKQAEQIGVRNRIGLFTLWTHETPTKQRIIRNYVHSKVGIVDDKWATIGSANLDGVSLILSQHIIPPITNRDEREERAIEVNAVVYNNVDEQPASSVPDELRRTLWAEHLGFDNANHDKLTSRPDKGWLQLWKDRAAAKLAGLNAKTPTEHAARILEWTAEDDPEDYLLALGVSKASLRKIEVMTEVRDFDFAKGKWK